MRRIETLLPIALTAALAGCASAPTAVAPDDPFQPQPYVQIQTPEWAKSATIYQLNTRQ